MPRKKSEDFEHEFEDDSETGAIEEDYEISGDLYKDLVDLRFEEPATAVPHGAVLLGLTYIKRVADGRILVDNSGTFYLLPKDFDFEGKKTVALMSDDSRLERLYTWEKEIEAMLPDRAALVKQIQRSLYLAGAYQKGDLLKNEVAKNWSRSAFPYVIQELNEE